MNIILFETDQRNCLLPLCYTRPVASLRTGILTVREKWEMRIKGRYSYKTEDYLSEKFPFYATDDNLMVSSHICPTDELAAQIRHLNPGEGIIWEGIPVAARVDRQGAIEYPVPVHKISWSEFHGELGLLRYPWDLMIINENQILIDFEILTRGRKSAPLSGTNQLAGVENIFAEEGVKCEFAVINATTGPVYLGKDSEIMEGSLIRGPFALCDHGVVNMGSRIYGATTVGPYAKIGGEVLQSVILGYSSKAHDGFLGHSVLGQWCNLGAGTNVSDLKNSYEKVKVWSYPDHKFIRTGLQFCGLIMGDHSKTGIGTILNTGTVIGVGCNIYGSGFPRQFVPSFSEGGAHGYEVHRLKTVFSTAEKAMVRRNRVLTDEDQRILTAVFERSAPHRKF